MSVYKQVRHNQSGMVSITVTMVMIIVITLIVMGFSEIVRRNTREALDRQLSTQAYYAAETGVNDAYNAIFGAAAYAVQPQDGQNCSHMISGAGASLNNKLNAAGTIAYTCLLVNSKSSSVVVTVPQGSSQTATLEATQAPVSLTFQWQSGQQPQGARNIGNCATNSGSNKFTPNTATGNDWNNRCPYGVLRLDLFSSNGNPGDAAAMANTTATVFFVPTTGGSPKVLTFGAPQNRVYTVTATCDDGAELCKGTVSGINGLGADGTSHYFARLTSIYEAVGQVTITSGNPGAQFTGYYTVDVTGKSQDVLRRIQVRIPAINNNGLPVPNNALMSGSNICKRYLIQGPGSYAGDGTATSDTDIPTQLCAGP